MTRSCAFYTVISPKAANARKPSHQAYEQGTAYRTEFPFSTPAGQPQISPLRRGLLYTVYYSLRGCGTGVPPTLDIIDLLHRDNIHQLHHRSGSPSRIGKLALPPFSKAADGRSSKYPCRCSLSRSTTNFSLRESGLFTVKNRQQTLRLLIIRSLNASHALPAAASRLHLLFGIHAARAYTQQQSVPPPALVVFPACSLSRRFSQLPPPVCLIGRWSQVSCSLGRSSPQLVHFTAARSFQPAADSRFERVFGNRDAQIVPDGSLAGQSDALLQQGAQLAPLGFIRGSECRSVALVDR